jgi:hypothetical protein
VYISRDVIFHESRFPYASQGSATPPNSTTVQAPIFPPILLPPPAPSSPQPPAPPLSSSNSAEPHGSCSSSYEETPHAQVHPMHTRSMNNIVQPRQLADGTVRYPAPRGLLTQHALATQEPTCFSNAVSIPEWRNAMQLEFNAFLHNQTWSLVPPHDSQNPVGCKWVFKLKRKADGSIERHKARLVAKGFHQQAGVDYGETYSLVVKPTTIRTVLSLAYSAGWSMKQIDIQNAFLHGLLSEDVHMV